MAQNNDYRHGLTNALESLEDAEGHALNAVVNIAMAGTYQSISRLHEPGEIVEFEPAMFEGLGDTNIDILLRLFYQIRETREKIKNLNGL